MRRLLTSVPLVELRSSIDQSEPVKVSWAWRRDTLGSRRAMSETERSRPMVTCAEVMLWLSPLTTSTSWASGRCGARVLAMLEAMPAAAPRPTAAPVAAAPPMPASASRETVCGTGMGAAAGSGTLGAKGSATASGSGAAARGVGCCWGMAAGRCCCGAANCCWPARGALAARLAAELFWPRPF